MDPTVGQIRAAAKVLGEEAWIAVRLPGEYEGENGLPDGAAIHRCIWVPLHPEELTRLREALALNSENDTDNEDELDPL